MENPIEALRRIEMLLSNVQEDLNKLQTESFSQRLLELNFERISCAKMMLRSLKQAILGPLVDAFLKRFPGGNYLRVVSVGQNQFTVESPTIISCEYGKVRYTLEEFCESKDFCGFCEELMEIILHKDAELAKQQSDDIEELKLLLQKINALTQAQQSAHPQQ